jgi:hypothetical protein
MKNLASLSLLSLLFAASLCVAMPIEAQRYEFTITLDCFYDFGVGGCTGDNLQRGDTRLGTPYLGTFAIDAALLANEGWIAATPLDFFFSTGFMIFDSSLPSGQLGDHFNGFVNYWGRPQTPDPGFNPVGNWGLQIQNHQLTQFCCYVFGDADAFGVDFSFSDMRALVRGYGGQGSENYYIGSGGFTFGAVPEPSSVVLALLAISLFAATRIRRKKGEHSPVTS